MLKKYFNLNDYASSTNIPSVFQIASYDQDKNAKNSYVISKYKYDVSRISDNIWDK